MTIDWQPLQTIIESNERFVLSSHVRPDADAVGSELGLAALLEGMGKSVRIVNPSGLPAYLEFLDPEQRVFVVGKQVSVESACDTDVHIVVDTSAWAQLSDLGKVIKQTKAQKVVIDHHVVCDDIGAMQFRDVHAEATGALIVRLADFLEQPITESMAGQLFCAIATDTGWFRFPSTTGETLKTCGRLVELGASPPNLYRELYERYSLARLKLAGRVLARMNIECDGRLAYVSVNSQDFQETGAVPADTEDLVNECLRVTGTEAAFIAIETPNRNVKVSLRSRNDLNVAAIAERFGGGGHKQAAGVLLPGPLPDAFSKILTTMKAELGE